MTIKFSSILFYHHTWDGNTSHHCLQRRKQGLPNSVQPSFRTKKTLEMFTTPSENGKRLPRATHGGRTTRRGLKKTSICFRTFIFSVSQRATKNKRSLSCWRFKNKQAAFILKEEEGERRGSGVLQGHLHPLAVKQDWHTHTHTPVRTQKTKTHTVFESAVSADSPLRT